MNNSVESASFVPAQEDFEAIMQSILDYVEGWYNPDVERMRRCLHPDLVKRTVMRDPQQGKWQLRRPTDAQMMVTFTQEGGGTQVPESERRYQITILDVFRHISTAKCVSSLYVDYLHLAKFDERWLIVNAMWELRQGELSPDS